MSKKVYILGAGSIGSLIAHELKTSNVIPIFLSRQNSKVQPTREVNLLRGNESSVRHISTIGETQLGNEIINNLIITTKTYQTESALKPYIKNLNSSSNILIMQNGLGMSQMLIRNYFKSIRPNFYESIITHGVYKSEDNIVNHASKGSISISKIAATSKKVPEVIKELMNQSQLEVEYIPYDNFILKQIRKFMINCCINPMSALYDCKNGDLLHGDDILHLWKLIVREGLSVLKLQYPEIETIPGSNALMNQEVILNFVYEIAKATSNNSSSMRQDVRNLRKTEIDYLNGYISYLGRQHGVSTPMNYIVENMIGAKLSIDRGIDRNAMESLLN